jgi:AraC-like DNA-binding protein
MFYCLDNELLPQITHMGRNMTKPDWKHVQRVSSDYILYLVNDGKMFINENGKDYILERGDMLLLEPDKSHIGFKEHFCDYYFIHFKPNVFTIFDCSEIDHIESIITENRSEFYKCSTLSDELYKKTKLFIPKDIRVSDSNTFNELTTKADEAITSIYHMSQHCKLICSSKFIEILAILSDYFSAERLNLRDETVVRLSKKVEEIIELIHQDYDKKLTGDTISGKLNQNYDYLNRIFKKQIGITIFEYLNNTRIDKAKELLVKGNLKSSEIAVSVGYCDEYRFCKVFKQKVGISPKKYSRLMT